MQQLQRSKGSPRSPKAPWKIQIKAKIKIKIKAPAQKRPGSVNHSKTAELVIHETIWLSSEGVKWDWIYKGYIDFNAQGHVIEPNNTKYRPGRWLTPEG
jgi:hypothetical protein